MQKVRGQEMQCGDGGGSVGKGTAKELRCIMYIYQPPTTNVTIRYYKHALIKNSLKREGKGREEKGTQRELGCVMYI